MSIEWVLSLVALCRKEEAWMGTLMVIVLIVVIEAAAAAAEGTRMETQTRMWQLQA